ncbi:hypothetical protein AAG570_000072 [Ranatra chinensis]|uniref:Uncharacterized protein n=1 Tax=Ranatra chinensis TaxID=642074 RepID=A0ABD0YW97_9HEMI
MFRCLGSIFSGGRLKVNPSTAPSERRYMFHKNSKQEEICGSGLIRVSGVQAMLGHALGTSAPFTPHCPTAHLYSSLTEGEAPQLEVDMVEEAVVTEVCVGAASPPPGAEHLQLSVRLLTPEPANSTPQSPNTNSSDTDNGTFDK